MKKTQALALLFAAGITLHASPAIAHATEISKPTMAELYQPYYEPTEARTDEYIVIDQAAALPRGTKFELVREGMSGFFRDGPLTTAIHITGDLQVMQTSRELRRYGENGYTTTPQVIITYPDNSVEIVSASAKVISTSAARSPVYYSSSLIISGIQNVISPAFSGEHPTKFELLNSPDIESLIDEGWSFYLNSESGELNVTVPEGESRDVPLSIRVTFADESSRFISLTLTAKPAPEPQPEPAPEPQPEPAPEPQPSDPMDDRSFGSSSS